MNAHLCKRSHEASTCVISAARGTAKDQARPNRFRFASFLSAIIGLTQLTGLSAHSQSAATENNAEALRGRPDNAVWTLLREGDENLRANNCRIAVELYGRVISLAPDLAAAHFHQARCWSTLGNYEAAAKDLRFILQRSPGDHSALAMLGWMLIELGHFREAQQITATAHRLAPLDLIGVANLAHTYLLLGDGDAARRLYREALELIPDDKTFREVLLADFDLFSKRGWSASAVEATRSWIKAEYPKFGAYRDAWAALNRGVVLLDKFQYREALPTLESAADTLQYAFGPNHPATAQGLSDFAFVYYLRGIYAKAEQLDQRALAIRERLLGPEHPSTATSLDRLAQVYDRMGAFAKAEPLFQRALAIRERLLGPEHPVTASNLSDLARLYDHMGAYAKAEPLFQRSLAIRENELGPEHSDTADSLHDLALLYVQMGIYTKAEPLFQRALAIMEKLPGPEHPVTATYLDDLATLYAQMGVYAKAEPLFQRALDMKEKVLGPEHPYTATSLNDLAGLYKAMGAYAKAEPLYQRALAIREKVLGPEHPNTATSLNNLARLYERMGFYAKAEPPFQRALAIRERALGPEHPHTALSLDNLAVLYCDMGANAKAEPLYQRALAIREKVLGPEHPGTATSLRNLARLYVQINLYDKAEPLYLRALWIASRAGDPLLLSSVESGMADLYAAEHQPELAIFWGKEAANTIQGVRDGIFPLDRDLQRSFLEENRGPYTRLTNRLVDRGRLPEAEQVLAMFKEQEYFAFVRGEADAPTASTHASLTDTEQTWEARYQVILDKIVGLGEEQQSLQQKTSPSAADKARIQEIELDKRAADAAFQSAIEEIQQGALKLAQNHQEQLNHRNLDTSRLGLVSDLNQRSGGGVVLLQYIVVEDSVRILMTTGNVQKAFKVQVGERQLNHEVSDLQRSLENPNIDPRLGAKRLYDDLIAPLSADLEQANARTLMLSLDGTLRYVPFAALYDGRRYMVDRYAISIFNEAVGDRITHDRLPTWRVAGLGRTEGDPRGFRPLPGVRQELQGIVHQPGRQGGILEGVIYLDAAFTDRALNNALSAGYPVLHLASHFHLDPAGNEASSYLLLGDGTELTLSDLRRTYRLPKVDLLTLSACETAVGGGVGERADGHEVEGMAVDAQKIGAMSVLATLWSVSDTSTAQVMEQFYRRHTQNSMNKAEALRQAQRAVMQGAGDDTDLASQRSADRLLDDSDSDAKTGVRFVTDPAHPYAHPYYWAPFVLMGNWL